MSEQKPNRSNLGTMKQEWSGLGLRDEFAMRLTLDQIAEAEGIGRITGAQPDQVHKWTTRALELADAFIAARQEYDSRRLSAR